MVAVVRCIQRRRDGYTAALDVEDDERSIGVGTVDLVVNIGAIVYVEVSLKWNNIAGVHSLNSPGQFMPFFIALGQFLSVFYSAAKYLLLLHAEENVVEEEDGESICLDSAAAVPSGVPTNGIAVRRIVAPMPSRKGTLLEATRPRGHSHLNTMPN